MTSIKTTARRAGVLYLIMSVLMMFGSPELTGGSLDRSSSSYASRLPRSS